MDAQNWLNEIQEQYRSYKKMCETAAAQVSDRQFFEKVGNCPHSIAILMKHVGGSNHSRWRDFLTTDGEKRDRNRETEFNVDDDTRPSVEAIWEQGWQTTLDSLATLTPADLERTITIRGEPHPVTRAIQRNLTHAACHAGQIVVLARHFAADNWQYMSIPPGKSDEYNASMQAKYGSWWEKEDQ